jgi:hypothetical protein
MNRDVADAVRAGTDPPRASFLNQQRTPGSKRVLLLVNRGDPAAFEHDEENIELGVAFRSLLAIPHSVPVPPSRLAIAIDTIRRCK